MSTPEFVVAQLQPDASFTQKMPNTPYARLAAAKIQTRPFLALRTTTTALDIPTRHYTTALLLVSSQPSPSSEPYASLILGPKYCADTGQLYGSDFMTWIQPPFPATLHGLNHPVYLHTYPLFRAMNHEAATSGGLGIQFVPGGFEGVAGAVRHSRQAAIERMEWERTALASSGGYGPVKEGWGAFSESKQDTDRIRYSSQYVFDIVQHPPSWSSLLEDPPTLYEEILLFKQLFLDYYFSGATVTIGWVLSMREMFARDPLFRPIDSRSTWRGRRLEGDALRGAMKALYAMRSRHEEREYSPEVEFWDDDELQLNWLPRRIASLHLDRVDVIAFDVFGTVLDREGAIRGALQRLLSVTGRNHDLTTLANLYIEFEALRSFNGPRNAALATIVHGALMDLVDHAGLPLTDGPEALQRAAADILDPPVYADACVALSTLRSLGYTLAFIPPHTSTTWLHVCRNLPRDLLASSVVCTAPASIHLRTDKSVYSTLLSQCRGAVPHLQQHQILLVSGGMWRSLISAQESGLSTALVQRPGNVEAGVTFRVRQREEDDPKPSLTVSDLRDLCKRLGTPCR